MIPTDEVAYTSIFIAGDSLNPIGLWSFYAYITLGVFHRLAFTMSIYLIVLGMILALIIVNVIVFRKSDGD